MSRIYLFYPVAFLVLICHQIQSALTLPDTAIKQESYILVNKIIKAIENRDPRIRKLKIFDNHLASNMRWGLDGKDFMSEQEKKRAQTNFVYLASKAYKIQGLPQNTKDFIMSRCIKPCINEKEQTLASLPARWDMPYSFEKEQLSITIDKAPDVLLALLQKEHFEKHRTIEAIKYFQNFLKNHSILNPSANTMIDQFPYQESEEFKQLESIHGRQQQRFWIDWIEKVKTSVPGSKLRLLKLYRSGLLPRQTIADNIEYCDLKEKRVRGNKPKNKLSLIARHTLKNLRRSQLALRHGNHKKNQFNDSLRFSPALQKHRTQVRISEQRDFTTSKPTA